MRATVTSQQLGSALKLSVASARTPMSILQHALITAHEGRLAVETTDTEVWVRTSFPADVEKTGSCMLLEALLRPIASVDGDIRISDEGKVSRGRSHFRVPVLPPGDFPLPDKASYLPLDLDAGELRSAIKAVSYCGEDAAPTSFMKALHVSDNSVWCTDGKQIGRVRIAYNGPHISIPIAQIPRVLCALHDDAKIHVGNVKDGNAGVLAVSGPEVEVVLRLLAHPAPNMEAIIQKAEVTDEHVVLKRSQLIAALRRFMPFAQWMGSNKLANWLVVVECARGELILTDRNGDNRESLDDAVVSVAGDFRFGMDPKRLLETVNAIETDTLTLHPPGDPKGNPWASVLLPAGASFDDIVHLVSPIKF